MKDLSKETYPNIGEDVTQAPLWNTELWLWVTETGENPTYKERP